MSWVSRKALYTVRLQTQESLSANGCIMPPKGSHISSNRPKTVAAADSEPQVLVLAPLASGFWLTTMRQSTPKLLPFRWILASAWQKGQAPGHGPFKTNFESIDQIESPLNPNANLG